MKAPNLQSGRHALGWRWVKLLVGASLVQLVLLWTIPVFSGIAFAMSIDRFILTLPNCRLELALDTDAAEKRTSTVDIFVGNQVLSRDGQWEYKRLDGERFRIRHPKWRGTYLEIDPVAGSVLQGNGGLEDAASMGSPLSGASCLIDEARQRAVLALPAISLTANVNPKKVSIAFEGSAAPAKSGPWNLLMVPELQAIRLVLAEDNCWQLAETGVSLYHLRHDDWEKKGHYWEVDAALRTVSTIRGERFGSLGDIGHPLQAALETEFAPKRATRGVTFRDGPMIPRRDKPDSLFAQLLLQEYESSVPVLRSDSDPAAAGKKLPPPSAWMEADKARYFRALTEERYDVLIVPFQVEGFALDRIERALMTRYLYDAAGHSSEFKLANPILVFRALGDGARTISDDEIFRLAKELGVKLLVRCFCGHNREERMTVTLLVQEKAPGIPLDSGTTTKRLVWNDIPFSDERMPSEAFKDILHEVVAGIPLGEKKPPVVAQFAAPEELPVPGTLEALVSGSGLSALRSAFHLQLLALLSFEESTAQEGLLERSLVALDGISPDSPDWRLLKATAFAWLGRRPAALAALGAPQTPEESSLAAFLNGNLPAMEEQVGNIRRPLPRLMARIMLVDLKRSYGRDREMIEKECLLLASEHPDLEALLSARLSAKDEWAWPSNVGVKEQLDALLPVPEYRLASLVASATASGKELSEENIDQAIYNHYHEAFRRELFGQKDIPFPVMADGLDLLFEHFQANHVKRIRRMVLSQGNHSSALESMSHDESLWRDHPELSYLKATAIGNLGRREAGEAGRRMEQEAVEIAQRVFFWSGGQTWVASRLHSHLPQGLYALPSYDGDFPRRPYWYFGSVGDRKKFRSFHLGPASSGLPETTKHDLKNAAISLAYTRDNLLILKNLFRKLTTDGLPGDARAVLDANRHRFDGHPLWPDLLTSVDGEAEEKKSILRKAMSDNPLNWDAHNKLAMLSIAEGDFAKAAETFMMFPPFHQPEMMDNVQLSHAAYNAAQELLFRGATDEAIPFLKIAVALGTGSSSEMGAAGYLAQLSGDYAQEAVEFLRRCNRYHHRGAYALYLSILHLAGYHDEAKALFDSLQAKPGENELWGVRVTALRVTGKSDEEIRDWFQESPMGKGLLHLNDGQVLIPAFLVDRGPNEFLQQLIIARQDAGEVYALWFAEGCRLILQGRYLDAYRTLRTRVAPPWETSLQEYRYALPALAWSAVKSGQTRDVEDLLAVYRSARGDDFHYFLAQACMSGQRGNVVHAEALLKKARQFIDIDYPPIFHSYPWYQLLEAAEWILEETKSPVLRDLILQWSRSCQKIYPFQPWGYSFEARHTSSAEDRRRSLGMTLYLDRNSLRIAGFTADEKEKASEWVKENNPFKLPGREETETRVP